MRKYKFLLAVIVMVVTSCQKHLIEESLFVQSVETSDPYAISEQEALVGLDEFMGAFDDSQTRSNHRRSVRSIRPVSSENILSQTRASACDDMGDLLYIVEFENGEGSAVLGADRRLKPVYAVLDESVLTIDDFANVANEDDGSDVAAFIAGVISNDVCSTMSDFGGIAPLLPPLDSLRTEWTDIVSEYVVAYRIYPLLNTKWCQTDIYNDKFEDNSNVEDDGKQCAGCVTIALGQILNYLTYPTPIELNNHTHYWRDINRFVWNHSITDSALFDKVANFVFDLSEELRVEYNDDGSTGADNDDVNRVLRQLGFNNRELGDITKSRIRPMLYNYKPVYASGYDSRLGGHAWVIDGWKTVERVDYCVTYDGFANEIGREEIRRIPTDYVHCNMGANGACDGYYVLDIFDLTDRRSSSEMEPGCGDVVGDSEYIFDTDLKALTYSF